MKKVLITGSSGFIGRHTLQPLLTRGYEIHAVVSCPNHLPSQNIKIHTVNLLDCNTHLPLMQQIKPTHLLHSAWYAENGKFWEAIENVYWLKASISLADAFFTTGGERLLGVGTCAEYDWNDGICIEGKTLECPSSLYGKMKKATFESLTALSQAYQKSSAWARIFFPYGPGESEQRLVPHIITHLLRDEIARCTHGNQLRDFLHVTAIGDALAAVLDSKTTGAINVGSGIPTKIRDAAEHLGRILNKKNLLHFGALPEPKYSPKQIVADVTKLTTEVGWSNQIALEEGLSRTVDWWRENINMNLVKG